jgi:hypothetical protein
MGRFSLLVWPLDTFQNFAKGLRLTAGDTRGIRTTPLRAPSARPDQPAPFGPRSGASGLAPRDVVHFFVNILDLQFNQAAHFVKCLTVRVKNLVQHKRVWRKLREFMVWQHMMQVVFLDQVPGIQIFHRSSFGAASLNALRRFD